MISSESSLLYAYAFYLFGRIRFNVPEHALQKAIGRWFFAASLTGRYTGSPESVMDGDLNRIKVVTDGKEFVAALDDLIANELTNDFWMITLPANLDSSSARNPELFAYITAQIGSELRSCSRTRRSPSSSTRHFSQRKGAGASPPLSRAFLERQGVTDLKQINQMANYALLEWPDNIDISDSPPSEYAHHNPGSVLFIAMGEDAGSACLARGLELMDYPEFLDKRRQLMASIIRLGFETLI